MEKKMMTLAGGVYIKVSFLPFCTCGTLILTEAMEES